MSATIIDGRAIARTLRQGLQRRVAALAATRGVVPALSVILVGDDAPSHLYVRNKLRACNEVGVHSQVVELPASIEEQALVATIRRLNEDEGVHGVLVQLPLPRHIYMSRILETIAVEKDVDGFHLYNVGGLVTGSGAIFSPCTPYAVRRLLEHEGIPIEGQNVVVVGASNIVGKPTALMLMQRDATVTICHAKTRDLAQYTILADILVVAAGSPGLIKAEMVRRGAVVIDVGINRLADGRIVGDVDFAGVQQRAAYLTPVPGGVGPLTVTMLLENTIAAAERRFPPSHA